MLARLTKRWRLRAAIAIAALYALCVLAAPLALAFADRALAAHCLTADHHGRASVHLHGGGHDHGSAHVYGDGAVHDHADDAGAVNADGNQTEPAGACCGLFCFAAVTNDLDSTGDAVRVSPIPSIVDASFAGRGPERINRPPITLSSL